MDSTPTRARSALTHFAPGPGDMVPLVDGVEAVDSGERSVMGNSVTPARGAEQLTPGAVHVPARQAAPVRSFSFGTTWRTMLGLDQWSWAMASKPPS